MRIFGHYHYTNGGGAGPWPTFYVRVAAPDVDVAPLTAAADEEAEESVGVWLAKDGARRPVALSAVTCKGPENQQTLGWSSGRLQFWTAPTGGTMLSGSSKSVSASAGGTYYAQGYQASGSVRERKSGQRIRSAGRRRWTGCA